MLNHDNNFVFKDQRTFDTVIHLKYSPSRGLEERELLVIVAHARS